MQNLVITNAGKELMTSLITKSTTASFTKIATSEHAYKKEELGNLLALEDIKQEVPISKLEQKDASTIEITAAITNEELTQGYYIKALGLYIKDNEGNEILYAVAIDDTPDHLSAFDNKTISSIKYRLNVRVSNSEQVTLEIDPKVYATAEQIEELSNSVSEISKSLQQVTEITTNLKSHAFNSTVNNLTTTTTGYALDATQGKVLNDKLKTTTYDMSSWVINNYAIVRGKAYKKDNIVTIQCIIQGTFKTSITSFDDSYPLVIPNELIPKEIIDFPLSCYDGTGTFLLGRGNISTDGRLFIGIEGSIDFQGMSIINCSYMV